MMEAPVVLLSMMPPVGPGTSLMRIPFCRVVCRAMAERPGGTIFAMAGISAVLPQKQPVQIG